MANTYYVGSGGNDGSAGTSWATRKLTLNGAEDIPVAAGDTVYVGAGVYREQLTCDVSGTAGNPITYIGDYDGSHTDGTGGVVRITGSDDDKTATRAYCLQGNVGYRTFRGFMMDTTTGQSMLFSTATAIIIDECIFTDFVSVAVNLTTPIGVTIQNCVFLATKSGTNTVLFTNGATLDDAGDVVQNCLFVLGRGYGVRVVRVGGITVKNCTMLGGERHVDVQVVPAAGQTVTVNNCVLTTANVSLASASAGYLIEDYNNLYANVTNLLNVTPGAHSTAYPPLLDTRWFFEMVNGGSMVTPFDLSAWSQLINLAGTSPPAADMRGTTVQGAEREWGPLEYDSTLDIEAGAGGAVSISPCRGNIG